MRIGLFVLIILTGSFSSAQDFRFKNYRVEDGLPGDLIKAVTQDKLGYFWIATDDGLVRYDGYRFRSFKSAFQSQYIKSFYTTSDQRLLVVADLELTEIISAEDTIIFRRLLPGARNATDTTIWYPKQAFEASTKKIWLAEPQSVVRWDGEKKFKRYDFGLDNRSPVFTRSYHFFEDAQKNLYTVSFQGKVFRYSEASDQFEQQDFSFPYGVTYVAKHDGQVYIASQQGVFQWVERSKKVKSLWPIENASHLFFDEDALWVSTNGKNLYRAESKNAPPARIKFDFDRIEHVYKSDEGDYWISTQRGLILAQRNIFKLADEQSQELFIEAVAENTDDHRMYYVNREHLIELTPEPHGSWKRKILVSNAEGYFQSLAYHDGQLWASNDFGVLQIQEGNVIRRWDFRGEGRFINDIFFDANGKLWLSQATNTQAIVIDPQQNVVTRYPIPLLPGSNINVIRAGHHGMYAASNGKSGYLFFKSDTSAVFRNVSFPLGFEPQSDFNVTDLVIQGGFIWMATTEGLLKYSNSKIERVNLGDILSDFPVAGIESLDQHTLLFSNALGLVRYDTRTNEYWLFDEASGLPSNTISSRGIFVSEDKHVWIASSMGLATADIRAVLQKTKSPVVAEVMLNGVGQSLKGKNLNAPFGSLIDLYFSSVTFPENKIIYQWREPARDSVWKSLKGNELLLSQLDRGEHLFQIRAKKNTGLGWSDPLEIRIIIGNPFWLDINFILVVILIIAIVAMVSYAFGIYFMNQRRKQLESLIQQRTVQLQNANQELTTRNTELDRFVYSASHDLSAPLKSILGLINITKLEQPNPIILSYLQMMEQTVRKLEHFISEVVSYSRNARLPVKVEEIQFSDFVTSILDDHQFAPDFSLIHFKVEDHVKAPIHLDTMRLKIILNNLISNAIKFHRPAGEVEPEVIIALRDHEDCWKVTVSDNGRGIPRDHLQHIFTMFYRAHETSAGSGLGLYIMKEAIEKIGGRVEVESEVGAGTTFHVFLPKNHS